jgi:hypothetical protein
MTDLPSKSNPGQAQTGQVVAFPERLLRAALHYASAGIPIFPLHPTEKKALIKGWQKLATTNERQIREWFKEHRDMRIATVAGKRSASSISISIKARQDGPAALDLLAIRGGLHPDRRRLRRTACTTACRRCEHPQQGQQHRARHRRARQPRRRQQGGVIPLAVPGKMGSIICSTGRTFARIFRACPSRRPGSCS